ncbi:MAG: hypothetical protein RL095_782 [Verrucomicrobiota bacterium]|jgi:uncharacterized membrane protein
MNAENPYSASRVSASPVNRSEGGIDIPAHAQPYLDSIRKGSPVIPFVISGVIAFVVMVAGFIVVGLGAAMQQQNGQGQGNPEGLLMGFVGVMLVALIPLIFMLIYEVRLIYRLASIMQLDDRAPSMSPTVSTVLCLIPLVNIVGMILFVLKIREHYPRLVAEKDLQDAPEINGTYLIVCLVCMFLGWIPIIGAVLSILQLVFGILLLIQFHKALNYFAARV